MKRIFVSVGTSLFDLLGPTKAFRTLRAPNVLAAWDEAAEADGTPELSPAEAEARFTAALEVAGTLDAENPLPNETCSDDPLQERIRLLRDAFVLEGDEAEKKMLSAELASLCRLLPRHPLAAGDDLVLLATDSPEGRLAGAVLGQVLHGHPVLRGARVDVAWPRHWQPHDTVRLAERGASNLLAAVSRRIATDLRARPFFVLTGGIKLGITVLCQVSCWGQVVHDGLFFKLEDPGGVYFPPCSFVQRDRDHVLLPHLPGTELLHEEVRFTGDLRALAESMEPPRGGGPAPMTTLVLTVGVGLVRARAELLAARFGSGSPLAEKTTWTAIDQHALCRSWQELRRDMDGAPSDDDLEDAVERVLSQLQDAWNAGRSTDLPAELAALRSLWNDAQPAPTPLLKGSLRVVLLATDSLTGEYCAFLVDQFLAKVEGISKVELEAVAGFHPFGELASDGKFFTRMAEVVADAARGTERLMMIPLGGTKLHLPLLTVLATRLRAPVVMSHFGLDRPVVVPWLESDGERVRGAGVLDESWPELASFPTVRLEVEGD